MPKLLLNMIVKNEAARIERALSSVAPYLGAAVILDTGSTDNTIDLIEQFCVNNDIPLHIERGMFVNFEQARNDALRLARGLYPHIPYILLMDADMELKVEAEDPFARLSEASYNLLQKGGSLAYWNKRLLHRDTPGQYRGVTHEYLDVGNSANLETAWFLDHADGANRPDKFKRDIALLEKDIAENPNRERSWFYLAQSYGDNGDHDKAIAAYKRRIELGGWDEEVWYSRYRMASNYRALGHETQYIAGLLDAYNLRPSRVEPVYDLARYYREAGKNRLANIFAQIAMQIPKSNDLLFVTEHAYTWGPKDEFSISGFYDPATRMAAYAVTDRLTRDKEAPEAIRGQAGNNLFHYLKSLEEFCPSFRAHQLTFDAPKGYTLMNPSIAAGGKYAVIRTVNYTINGVGQYIIDGEIATVDGTPIHTRNFLCHLDENLMVSRAHEIIPSPRWPAYKYRPVLGWEDMRLIERGDGSLWVNACVREQNTDGICTQFAGHLKFIGPHYEIDKWREMKNHGFHQKNWVPIEGRDGYLYRLDTLVDNRGEVAQKVDLPFLAGHISGSGQVIKFNGGYLTISHEARPDPTTGKRYYIHRFVYFNGDMVPTKISLPFVIHNREIEFVAGLTLRNDKVVLSYGRRDAEAWIGTLDRREVWGMLQ